MIMINFINFVFSLKSKHENKKQYGNHTPSLGNTFFVSQKNNLQLIELEWGASKWTVFYSKIEDENLTEGK